MPEGEESPDIQLTNPQDHIAHFLSSGDYMSARQRYVPGPGQMGVGYNDSDAAEETLLK